MLNVFSDEFLVWDLRLSPLHTCHVNGCDRRRRATDRVVPEFRCLWCARWAADIWGHQFSDRWLRGRGVVRW